MSAQINPSEVLRWMRYAREDLQTAELIVAQGNVPRAACFHAQQAAEKALKALLILRDTTFPRVHELYAFRRLLPEGFDAGAENEELVRLSRWAIDARYPGDLTDATKEDAETAIGLARKVYEKALEDLKRHGYDAAAGHSEG